MWTMEMDLADIQSIVSIMPKHLQLALKAKDEVTKYYKIKNTIKGVSVG